MKILFVFGTRPEAIKMLPIYLKFKQNDIDAKICLTAQHREMLDDVMDFFEISADYDLNLMGKNQTLEELSSLVLKSVGEVLKKEKFDLVFVHGDTTTTFFSAMAAYYNKIDIAHIEAGLRTYDMYSPFPEEINRQLTSRIAKYHFTPTKISKENLLLENLNHKNIYVVGNSVIDALYLTMNKTNLKTKKDKKILITAHRRENFGKGIVNICDAIKKLAEIYKDFEFIYPVHLNPNIQKPVFDMLSNIENVKLLKPQSYFEFVKLMSESYLILTDSGGVQEEALSLSKPVLLLRDTTERVEALNEGAVKLIGTQTSTIIKETQKLIDTKIEYEKMTKVSNPYGDGKTSDKILEVIKNI